MLLLRKLKRATTSTLLKILSIYPRRCKLCGALLDKAKNVNQTLAWPPAYMPLKPGAIPKKKDMEIDHINSVKTDNRKANLRNLCYRCHREVSLRGIWIQKRKVKGIL